MDHFIRGALVVIPGELVDAQVDYGGHTAQAIHALVVACLGCPTVDVQQGLAQGDAQIADVIA